MKELLCKNVNNELIVYYQEHVENDVLILTVTDKEYFDEHHCLDDGTGDNYTRIMDAFNRCGYEDICDSTYAVDDLELESDANMEDLLNLVTYKLAKHNIRLVKDEKFDEFLKQYN